MLSSNVGERKAQYVQNSVDEVVHESIAMSLEKRLDFDLVSTETMRMSFSCSLSSQTEDEPQRKFIDQ